MREDDIDYYRKRQQQELYAASRATDICCCNVHLKLAGLYGLRLAEASRVTAINAETPPGAASISVQQFSFQPSAIDTLEQEFL